MATIQKLFEKKGKILKQMEESVTRAEKDSDGMFDSAEYDAWEADLNILDKEIKAMEAAKERISKLADLKLEDPKVEEKEASFRDNLDAFIRKGVNGQPANIADKSKRAYVYNLTDATGGYFVPDLIGDHVETAKAYVGGMVTPGLCNWFKTKTGSKVEIPTVDDTAVKAAVVAEETALTSGSVPTYSTSDLDFYKITSHIVKISRELLQDSVFNVVDHATGILMARMMRGLNYYFTLGTSGSHPVGIQTLSTKGVDIAKRGITRANIVNLIYSVNRAYRPNAAFQMNDATMGYIRKLAQSSGSTGQDQLPAWQDNMRAGEPNFLEGYPVVANNDMDELESYNQAVFFGDWKRYYIAECLPMTMIRLDELYAESDQIALVVLGRWAGNLIAYSGDAPIKHTRNANT